MIEREVEVMRRVETFCALVVAAKKAHSMGAVNQRRTNTVSKNNRLEIERLPSVIARTGRSRASLYRDISEGTFPAQVRIGKRAVGWNPAAVDRWIANRFASVEAAS